MVTKEGGAVDELCTED